MCSAYPGIWHYGDSSSFASVSCKYVVLGTWRANYDCTYHVHSRLLDFNRKYRRRATLSVLGQLPCRASTWHRLLEPSLIVPSNSIPSPAANAPITDLGLEETIERAKRAFALKNYENAVDYYVTALELMYVASILFTVVVAPLTERYATQGQHSMAKMHLRWQICISCMGKLC
jgi:hypothetical protein